MKIFYNSEIFKCKVLKHKYRKPSIFHEVHKENCSCSYCFGDSKLSFGLNIPKDWKAWNSWYVIKYWDKRYIRWTFSFLKKF